MTRLVGLDVGTSSVKGLAIDQHGTVLTVVERGYPLSTPRPGWSEQDPDDWWRAATEVLDALDADRALGIGLSGQMHGLVALGADQRPLRPAILWNDGRTGAEADWIEERAGGRERLVSLTGNRALVGFTAPKLEWVRRNEPDVYARIARVLLPKDYVRLRLCGESAMRMRPMPGGHRDLIPMFVVDAARSTGRGPARDQSVNVTSVSLPVLVVLDEKVPRAFAYAPVPPVIAPLEVGSPTPPSPVAVIVPSVKEYTPSQMNRARVNGASVMALQSP
jgi:hypothetical protein